MSYLQVNFFWEPWCTLESLFLISHRLFELNLNGDHDHIVLSWNSFSLNLEAENIIMVDTLNSLIYCSSLLYLNFTSHVRKFEWANHWILDWRSVQLGGAVNFVWYVTAIKQSNQSATATHKIWTSQSHVKTNLPPLSTTSDGYCFIKLCLALKESQVLTKTIKFWAFVLSPLILSDSSTISEPPYLSLYLVLTVSFNPGRYFYGPSTLSI